MHRLTYCFLLLSFTAFAQFPKNAALHSPFPLNDGRWGVSLAPGFVLTPSLFFTIQPGVEYRLSDRVYSLLELAIPVSRVERDSGYTGKSYFRAKAEIKYVFEGRRKILGNYIKYVGLQTSYSFRQFKDVNGGSYFIEHGYDRTTIRFDRASIKSPIFTASLQFGTMLTFSDNFCVDTYIGLGVRTIFTKYSHVANPNVIPNPPDKVDFGFIYDASSVDGTVSRFHPDAGVRLIYRF